MKLPVVLFVFRRSHTLEGICERILKYNPPKVYVYGDGPRDESEESDVAKTRRLVTTLLADATETVFDFSSSNRGVKENIGGGALKTFEKEESAIFLEDDSLPSDSFFHFCEELIEKYRNDERVMWICGTNWEGDQRDDYPFSYGFTMNLLPCGWASWSSKFRKYYDEDLVYFSPGQRKSLANTYQDKRLAAQEFISIRMTKWALTKGSGPVSWDRQLSYSLRRNGLLGIYPLANLITNIGADHLSTHGGTSMKNPMTARVCNVPHFEIDFPLVHPPDAKINDRMEHKMELLILRPFRHRLMSRLSRIVKPFLFLSRDQSLTESRLLRWIKKCILRKS